MSRQLVIDRLNIRLPQGWRGDPSLLARHIAEQLQAQAGDLRGGERLDLQLRGAFAGSPRAVSEQLGRRLAAASRKPGGVE